MTEPRADPRLTAHAERIERRGISRRQAAAAYGFTVLTLSANFATGLVIARTLGSAGRGELAAITGLPQLVGWVFATGCLQAVAYAVGRDPRHVPRLIGSWLVLLAPLGILALLVGELLAPVLLSAQTRHTIALAQIYMATIALALLSELAFGVLLGDHDFFFYNAIRFARPAATALIYVTLWHAGRLSVASALVASTAVGVGLFCIAAARAVRRFGIGAPDRALALESLGYGLRVHATNIGSTLNVNLDSTIIPAFLGASAVGLYSVASNVSWIVPTLAGALSALVLPAAARQGRTEGAVTVIRSLQTTLAVGVVAAAAVAAVSIPGLRAIYGNEFRGSLLPLLLLLPGSALYAAAAVLTSGLAAFGRPLAASAAQLGGIAVTVPGLLLFLRSGGIVAAAVVSNVAYSVVFVVSLVLFQRVAGVAWLALIPRRLSPASEPVGVT